MITREKAYYQITFFEDKEDDICQPPYRGDIKSIKWLKYGGNDKGLPVNQEVEDENLAIRILIQNLKKEKPGYFQRLLGKNTQVNPEQGRSTRETLENTILGKYEKVKVTKYRSNYKIK